MANRKARAKQKLDTEIAALFANLKTAKAPEVINHPAHYNHGGIEVIDAIEAWSLGFSLGNAVKYIARADHKGKDVEDLKKARWYLEREIARRERKA